MAILLRVAGLARFLSWEADLMEVLAGAAGLALDLLREAGLIGVLSRGARFVMVPSIVDPAFGG